MLAVAPDLIGGLWLRARAGPAREALRATLAQAMPGAVRLHPAMDAGTLTGGTDLTATLAAGRLVMAPGLLAGARFVLTMAERCPPALAALIAQRLDRGGAALVALDESASPDEGVPRALTDRMGLFVDLDALGAMDLPELAPDGAQTARARARLDVTAIGADHLRSLTGAALALGIDSARAVVLAAACARISAALRDAQVGAQDLDLAAALVLAPRATRLPDTRDDPAPPPPDTPPDTPPDETTDSASPADTQAERLVEAARTALPADLLDRLAAGRASRATASAPASGAGVRRKGSARGRPLPPRPGRPGGAARVDIVATLAAAAPWQGLRRRQMATPRPVVVLPGDIRLRRYQDRSERVLILAVDASGSQAMTRLAESKGAVELLLARAYVRRDQVALIAFRGTTAEVMLPPTRSLVQAKRRLAGLPGGGGTPLALGLQAALGLAVQARGRGLSPALALLTDGRANIGLDGQPGRTHATDDAQRMARVIAAQGFPVAVIDTALRPNPVLADLARLLGTAPVALPRPDAGGLSAVLGAALDAAAPG